MATSFDQKDREGFDYKISYDSGEIPSWEDLSEAEQDELDFRRAIYAAQVEHMDRNIGKIIEDLTEKGILDDTLILFMSDNGCSGELGLYGMNWPEYSSKNYSEWRTEGGWATAQGQCWASLSNAPLRKYKIFTHEGGIASPFIAHWPSKIDTPGRICTDQVFHMIDILPTFSAIAGVELTDRFEGRQVTPPVGISIMPWLDSENQKMTNRTLYWQHETSAAIRDANWKLVTSDDRDKDAWELYDLCNDRSETRDLSKVYPDKVEELFLKWRNWALDSNVLPYPETRNNLRRIDWPPE
jgi:arylsulfatase